VGGVKFVITLDADTQLPQGSARRLVETLAHPLNRPVVGEDEGGRMRGEGGAGHSSALVSRGYTVIQPRVSTSLPSATATRFSRLFTDPTGSDPYTHAISDVYQDLFGEGSYHGKGIYDVQAFHKVLSGRFPDATLLSHDLIEGAHVRVGLASDIELFDQFPPNYLSYSRRNHRWLRGDWQILDWVLPTVPSGALRGVREANALSLRNRWKVADNLRRSELPVASVALLLFGWLHSPGLAVAASALVGAGLLLPAVTQFVTWLPHRVGGVRAIAHELGTGALRGAVEAALLPHSSLLSIDAVTRTLRRRFSQRNLLEWETAQSNYASAVARERAFVKRLGGSTVFAISTGLAVAAVNATALPVAAPYLLGWAATPLLVRWLSGRDELSSARDLSAADLSLLRRLSRQTWRYFDDFIGPQTNWLPPDNYQESLRVEIAQRTSPTNIGLWLLSLLAARDFGYVPLDEVIGRTRATLDTLDELERYRGHFLNWYATQTMEPLRPRYVSTVDSGNLLGSLWTMAQGVREMLAEPLLDASALHGLNDALGLLKESFQGEVEREIATTIETLEHLFDVEESSQSTLTPTEIVRRLHAAQNAAGHLMQLVGVYQVPHTGNGSRNGNGHELANFEDATSDPRTIIAPASYWAAQIGTQVEVWIQQVNRYLIWLSVLNDLPDESTLSPDDELLRRRNEALERVPSLEDLARGDVPALQRLLELRGRTYLSASTHTWLEQLADEFGRCRWLAGEMRAQGELLIDSMKRLSDEMDMRFLYDEDRKLFTIGFSVDEMRRDASYYDLIASECRIASFATVARGEVPLEHWVALGRRFGDCGGRAVLMSWSGTMFEYLMPLLLMKPFENSLLAQSCRAAVLCQIDYGRERGVPWGISEAAFAALDAQRIYQYKAFGVPSLGLKRGLEDDLVVAPYATMMAFAVEPKAAMQNLHRLLSIGMRGDYGLYESIDYSRQRLRDDDASTKDTTVRGAIVRCFMVHHQGMSLVAIDNFLNNGAMQNRFHADPYVQAAESLLHERIPAAPPVVEEALPERPPARLAIDSLSTGSDLDRFASPDTPLPRVHLLSNGHYSVMVTNAGGGYSRWNDFEITRWRADSTRDNWGSWFYLKDLESNVTWSSAHQPLRRAARQAEVLFAADKAEFRRRDADIETQTEVFVSPEDDAEIRRLILTNRSNRARTVEVTSYAELSLAPHAADRAHPAFNKLFIQTAALPEGDALLAWRRLRSPKDTPIWAGHLVTGERLIVREEEPVQSTLNGNAAEATIERTVEHLPPISYETDRAKFLGRGR
ncbi:MAG: cyclic beta,2-glucan synthetase, partial [Abditibacteriota bacterium]|nr:cyclic beta,2-glucan synthetase [Abditibacteriota bacterium]